MRYFKKIYPQHKVVLSNGRGFTFPTMPSGEGAHATDNPELLKQFDFLISKKVGGITEISRAEFEALKKKAPPPNHNEALSPSKVAEIALAKRRAAAERAARPVQLTPTKREVNNPGPLGRNSKAYQPTTVNRP
jgi:hypothetical protein